MAYSYVVYTGNGATTQFTVPFPYIRREHVVASIERVATTAFTWVNSNTIQFDTAPGNGDRVEIRRVTPVNQPLVDFTDGSTLVAADLDTNALQQTYINQEQDDQIQDAIFVNAQGDLDAGGRPITNVDDPTNAQDVATKAYVDTQDALKVSKAGDSMTGALAMGTNKITGLGDPTNAQDAATKNWVETSTTAPLVQFRSIFYGAYATDPAVDPYGAARTEGDLYFNTTLDQMRVFNGTSWQEASADATITRFKFTAAGGETSLSGNDDDAQSLTYNVGLEMVYLNGALLTRGVDYVATTGSSITGLVALAAADLVEVVAFSQIDAIGSIPSANSTFLQSGTGAVQRTVDSKLKDAVSAADFGALPSASASTNRTAFNDAFQYLHDRGGGTLFVPAGTYDLSDTLRMGRNTTLKCETGVRFVRQHNNTFLTNSLGVTSGTTGYTGNGNIVIDGGIWDGNSIAFYDAFNHLAIGHCENVTIKNAVFLDNIRAHAVDLSACRNVLIENNKFLGYADAKTSPDGYGTSSDTLGADRTYSEAIQLDHNVPGSFGFGAIDRTQCENVVFRNNVVGPNPARNDNTFKSYGAGIGSHGSVNNRYMKGIVVEGNQFIDCIFAGVRPWKWVDVTITGNTFRGCVRGVHVTPTSFSQTAANNPDGTPSGQGQAGFGYTITGNVFDSYSDIGVFFTNPTFDTANAEPVFYHRKVTITGNTFSNGTTNSAVECKWVEGLVADGNTFRNVFRPFELEFVVNAVIANNSAITCEREFLFFAENTPSGYSNLGHSRNLAVIGNSGSDIGYSGINVGGAMRGFTVLGNALRNVSTFAATRFGIAANTNARDGYIAGNNIEDAGATNKPVYGISVTGSCSNVSVGPNKLFGTTGPMQNLASTVPHSDSGPLRINSSKTSDVPGIYLDSFFGTEGEISVNTAEALDFGWWDGTTFTSAVTMSGGGNWNPGSDNTRQLGTGALRWKEVFAVNGTINTSDERSKQDIASLDEAEKRVALALKGLIKKYRFKDAVEKKGDDARIHCGVIAQEVVGAFADEGLDATRYGLLCYDEWEAEHRDVMEAVVTVNEDGEEQTEMVPTGERKLVREAGNRYGIRYEELLAFVLAAL